MSTAELRKIAKTLRCFAVEPADDRNRGKGGWAWSVQFVTSEPDSIAGMQARVDSALTALLDVAEAAERWGRTVLPARWPGYVAKSEDALAAALKRLEEA